MYGKAVYVHFRFHRICMTSHLSLIKRHVFKKINHYRDNTCLFHALTFAGSRGSCLNPRPQGRAFKHRRRGPASVTQ